MERERPNRIGTFFESAPKGDPSTCPHCGSQRIEGLAYQNGIRRYNCRACDRNFCAIVGTPRVGDPLGGPVIRIPDDPRVEGDEPVRKEPDEEFKNSPFRRRALDGLKREEANMAVPTVCGKCYKEFSSKAYAKVHGRKCKGAASDVAELTAGDGDPMVKILKAERQKIADRILAEHPEIKKLDSAIEMLEARPT